MTAGPFNEHKCWVTSVAFSPDGKQVVSGSEDKTLYVGRMHDGALPLFTDCTLVDVQGWVTLPGNQLLFWVPHLHQCSLHRPSTIKVIGPHETCLDFSKSVFGDKWTLCYTSS